MSKYEKGKIVTGSVTGIEPYGIFVSLDDYYSGLIHISEISHCYVKSINNFVKIGDIIRVKIIDVDEKLFQLKLSIKDINYKIKNESKRNKIVETGTGFNSLRYKLPFWIKKYLKK